MTVSAHRLPRAARLVFTMTVLACLSAVARAQAPEAATKAASTAARPALVVNVATPTRGELAERLGANGSIAAWQEASVGAEIAGLRLAEVLVDVGDKVQRGQVLARFAAESVEADLAVAEAGLAQARAALAEAQANAARARQVQDSGVLSSQQVTQYLTGEATAAAQLQAAQAQVALQRLRLAHTRVLAPDDGLIAARAATLGAVAAPGQELFRLVRRGRLEWRGEVTAAELPRLRVGQPVTVIAASGARLRGTVRVIAPTVDPQSRNALVYVDLPAGSSARAGMFARGEFEFGATAALTVPQAAVVVRDGFSHVFELGTGDRVQRRRVEIGRRSADRIEITAGLRPVARVVVSGAGFLNDGDLVKVAGGAK
jgi:RND family efflux transporter MFP subunit